MDIFQAIKELFEEKKRVDRLIAALEAKQRGLAAIQPKRRRGRTSMNEEERRQVSERMRRYWQQRRQSESTELSLAS